VTIIIVVVVAATTIGGEEGADVTLVTSPVEVKVVVVVTAALKGGTGQRGGANWRGARRWELFIIYVNVPGTKSKEHSVSRSRW
jgi:hypothetical protein